MASSNEQTTLIIAGVAVLGGWYAYSQGWLSSLFPSTAAASTTPAASTTTTTTTKTGTSTGTTPPPAPTPNAFGFCPTGYINSGGQCQPFTPSNLPTVTTQTYQTSQPGVITNTLSNGSTQFTGVGNIPASLIHGGRW